MAEPTFNDLRNSAIILFVITFFVTSYRCFARYKKGLWWHDDSVALFSMLFFITFPVGWGYITGEPSSQAARIVGCYIAMVGFYTAVWGGRISILLTVVRITPWQTQRRILIWVTAFFALQFAVLTAQALWICELTDNRWKQIPGSICILPQVVPISQIVTTVISDTILISAPLMIARGLRVPALRFRLFSIFSVSIATTLASVAHAILVIVEPGIWEATFAGVEGAVSIIVCNMSVIIPAILRVLGVGDPFMQEDTVDPNFSTVEIIRMTSTRVELGLPVVHGTVITDSDDTYEDISMAAPQRGGLGDLDAKDDRRHQLTTQPSDATLGDPKTTKVVPLVEESDIADSLAQVRGLPAVKKDQDVEVDIGENTRR